MDYFFSTICTYCNNGGKTPSFKTWSLHSGLSPAILPNAHTAYKIYTDIHLLQSPEHFKLCFIRLTLLLKNFHLH